MLKYIERIKAMDQLIHLKATGTSEEFAEKLWSSYKPLVDHPLDALVKASLEKHGPLEKQFQSK